MRTKSIITALILTITLVSCKKKQIDPPVYPPNHNYIYFWDFKVTNSPDTVIAQIDEQPTYPVINNGGWKYKIGSANKFNIYCAYKLSKTSLVSKDHPIDYYQYNEDKNSPYYFAMWLDSISIQTLMFFYPKQRIIVHGTDTTYQLYIKGQLH